MPDHRGPQDVPRTFADVPRLLRSLRAHAGDPSFSDISRRISAARQRRGLDVHRARVGRTTVYDAFRSDRKRLDTRLVLEIAAALGARPALVEQWRTALASIRDEESAASVVTVTAQLPGVVPGFVGRAAQLAEITSHPGPVWISGMPGAGKSQLAFRAARELVAAGAITRVLVADLRGFSPHGPPADAHAVLGGLLRTAGLAYADQPTDTAVRARTLAQLLRHSRTGVLLDDAADSEDVARIFPDPEGVVVLVTSRAAPSGASGFAHLRLPLFSPEESVALVRAVVGAERTDAEPATATALADTAAHLPLAVRLTASRVAARPEWSLADHLGVVESRHRSLRLEGALTEAFTASYRALPEDARRMLRLLAIHPIALLDEPSVSALAAGDVGDPAGTLELLVRHGLLTSPRRGRYGLHELLRLHAATISLEEDPPTWRAAARRRLVSHLLSRTWSAYTARARARGEIPRTPREEVQLVEMTREEAEDFLTENVDLLLTVGLGEAWGEDRTAPVTAVSEALSGWLDHLGRLSDAHLLHRAALRHAQDQHDLPGERRARCDLGMRLASAGHYAEAEAVLRQAAVDDDDPVEAASVSNALGIVVERQGEAEEAMSLYSRSLSLAERAGDRRRTGDAWNNIAGVHLRQGRLDEGQQALERAMASAREVGDDLAVARSLVNLCNVAITRGDAAAALDAAQESLRRFEAGGLAEGSVVAAFFTGRAYTMQGRHRTALDWMRRSLAKAQEIGKRQHEVTALVAITETLVALDELVEAERSARSAVAAAEELGDPYEQAAALVALGDCQAALGEETAARESWSTALVHLESVGSPNTEQVRQRLAARV